MLENIVNEKLCCVWYPVNNVFDFVMNDGTKNYYAHCTRPDGVMKPFDEIKKV
jgi:hypothetical protein